MQGKTTRFLNATKSEIRVQEYINHLHKSTLCTIYQQDLPIHYSYSFNNSPLDISMHHNHNNTQQSLGNERASALAQKLDTYLKYIRLMVLYLTNFTMEMLNWVPHCSRYKIANAWPLVKIENRAIKFGEQQRQHTYPLQCVEVRGLLAVRGRLSILLAYLLIGRVVK